MTQINNVPYANLDPSLILDAIESVGYRCSGNLLGLNSYENRVYQVGIEDTTPIIAKFYRPERWTDDAILEEHYFSSELVNREIPVIAPLASEAGDTLHHFQGFRFALFPRQGGRALELENLEQLEWMGRFIGRLHSVGAIKKFQHRMKLDVQSYGYKSYQFLIENNFIPSELKKNFCITVESLLQKIEQNFKTIGPINNIRLHGDCHPGNVLWNTTGPQIVDLDDCLMGPAIQDIWMLLSGDEGQVQIQVNRILNGYCEFHDFNYRELYLVETLRSLRRLQYSAWLAKRWEDPAFPLNFPWFNTNYYWQELMGDLNDMQYSDSFMVPEY